MEHKKEKPTEMPQWLLEDENYIPKPDTDTFVNKSILSLLKVISKIKAQDSGKAAKYRVNVPLKMALTFMLIILLSVSRSFQFVLIINVYQLLVLSSMKADKIVKILKVSLGSALFTFVVMLPALLWGSGYSCIMITSKAFAAVTAAAILSHTTKWSSVTSALKSFFLPDLFILVLDLTIKYIFLLGDFTLNMLYSLKLRSVGKNRSKYAAMSGVAGTLFVKSKEMSEEMYYAMECRGFTGEYYISGRSEFSIADAAYIIMNIGIIAVFLYFQNAG